VPAQDLGGAVSVARMQAIDAEAITALGIPRLILMEHAGRAVAGAVRRLLPKPASVLVCSGTGFNGGDGLAAARHLHQRGYPVAVVLAGRRAQLREEPAVFAAILERLGVRVQECPGLEQLAAAEQRLAGSRLVVDALLGIGARGAAREPIASLIAAMNRCGATVVSADVPSGLDGDTGAVQGVAVKATATVAFGLVKRGCLLGQGPAHAGRLIVDAITIPPHLLRPT
jgi:NAD(P)H-hydrate epimerase